MADLNSPIYSTYASLCREIKLERDFEHGDWYTEMASNLESGHYNPNLPWIVDQTCRMSDQIIGEPGSEAVWMPSITDWMERLRELGAMDYTISWSRFSGEPWSYCASGYFGEPLGKKLDGNGPTPEEAAARLWILATKENKNLVGVTK